MRRLLLVAAVGVALAACGRKPDPMDLVCPPKAVRAVQASQKFFEGVEPGKTTVRDLRTVRRTLARRATLARAGDAPVQVWFYQANIPGCPWVAASAEQTYMPVVISGKVVTAYGMDAVRDMLDNGWAVKEASWPWQRYDFGYLPAK